MFVSNVFQIMMRRAFFTIFIGLLLIPALSTAQPDLIPYGCRYIRHQMHTFHESRSEDELLAENSRSDSFDILNYDIYLDLTAFSQKNIKGACGVQFAAKADNISVLPLDLVQLTVDSVKYGDTALAFTHISPLLNVDLPVILNNGDIAEITVYYHGIPAVDPTGFGGFDFDGNMCYNLGIGFSADPLPVGRTWFPCFDNFVERATYDFSILTNGGRKGFANGTFLDETETTEGLLRRFRMDQPIPTYLTGVVAADYTSSHTLHDGVAGDIPLELTCSPGDTAQMKLAFQYLGDAINELEDWYGPYYWERLGFILTPVGAMEHCTNIHYPGFIIEQGPDFGQNKLMAHELAHHWWGNITTLSTPSNMWIKEGNAEYGAHLFFEHVFGKDYFKEVVKDNQLNVIRNAHRDDGGIFHPLSPMPFEYTYGTHTYDKGAAVMHTLRGYMGDSLFSQGMRSILTTYPYISINAEQFRDQLIANTGLSSLNSFFDDWIFSPGFAAYELDSTKVVAAGAGNYNATVYIQQKLYAAPHFHANVPLEITFFDQNWDTFDATVLVSGEFTTATVMLPFEPVYQIINDNNKLNLGQMQNRSEISGTTIDIDAEHAAIGTFQVTNGTGPALINATHFYVAPDPAPANAGFRLSNSHYWNVGGVFPAGFKMKGILEYRGAGDLDLDHDLTAVNEDSVILVWRPDAATPWAEYPYYAKLTFSTTNGFGYMRIDTLYPGDYAFANDLDLSTSADVIAEGLQLTTYPNPADEYIVLEGEVPEHHSLTASLYDNSGKLVSEQKLMPQQQLIRAFFLTKALSAGYYTMMVTSGNGQYLKSLPIIIE